MNFSHKIRYFFNWIFNPQFIAGEKAEKYFEELCGSRNYIFEKIPQDKKNFAKYAAHSQNHIKRGDYLIRNLKNLEVEVKCYTRYKFGSKDYYAIKYSHIKRHEEMERITNEPVVFAIFERNGRNVVKDSLRMIPLKELTSQRKTTVFYDKRMKCLCIPLNVMYVGFHYFDIYKYKLTINKH